MLLLTSVIVKFIGAVYKIPLTAFIGAVGRGYFAAAYNVYLPVHALLMGAFPIALSRLVSKYNANPTDTELLSQYTEIMTQYAEFSKTAADMEDRPMTPEEEKYFTDAMLRIDNKLLTTLTTP